LSGGFKVIIVLGSLFFFDRVVQQLLATTEPFVSVDPARITHPKVHLFLPLCLLLPISVSAVIQLSFTVALMMDFLC
jgi:hypothetical protein